MSKSTQPETTRHFAYGRDHVDCHACPAIAAGFEPSAGDDSLPAAEAFDQVVRSQFGGEHKGAIPETEAQDAWTEVVDKLTRRWNDDDPAVYTAREIARELGWN